MAISMVEQGSYEWHVLRQGKVTGTTLASALGSPKVRDTLMYKIISERMTEPKIDDINSPAIQRGRELEPLARKAVEAKTGLTFTEVGMMLNPDIEHFGVSPDGVYFESDEKKPPVGGVEIKCPDSKKHVEYLIKEEIPKEYLNQVKAPFLACDSIDWWVFASFDDRNYEEPLFIKMVTRKDFPDLAKDRKDLIDYLNRVDETHMKITF